MRLADPLIASVLLPPGARADARHRELVRQIQAADRPALVTDDVDLRAALEADGVHLTDAAGVATLRRKLSDGMIIGAECPAERHACMEAAEDGADYVAVQVNIDNYDAVLELLTWWQEVMTVPIVAFVEDDVDARSLATSADFLSPPPNLAISRRTTEDF